MTLWRGIYSAPGAHLGGYVCAECWEYALVARRQADAVRSGDLVTILMMGFTRTEAGQMLGLHRNTVRRLLDDLDVDLVDVPVF